MSRSSKNWISLVITSLTWELTQSRRLLPNQRSLVGESHAFFWAKFVARIRGHWHPCVYVDFFSSRLPCDRFASFCIQSSRSLLRLSFVYTCAQYLNGFRANPNAKLTQMKIVKVGGPSQQQVNRIFQITPFRELGQIRITIVMKISDLHIPILLLRKRIYLEAYKKKTRVCYSSLLLRLELFIKASWGLMKCFVSID